MGEILARNEVFIFTVRTLLFYISLSSEFRNIYDHHRNPYSNGRGHAIINQVCLIQNRKFLKPRHSPCPDPGDYICNLTRIPDDFYMQVLRV